MTKEQKEKIESVKDLMSKALDTLYELEYDIKDKSVDKISGAIAKIVDANRIIGNIK